MMKKIKLNLPEDKKVLTKEQMKKISGGYTCCHCGDADGGSWFALPGYGTCKTVYGPNCETAFFGC